MLIRRLRTTGALLLCTALLLLWGGFTSVAFGDSPCADKAPCAEKPAKKCGICAALSGKCADKSPCAEKPVKKCGICDVLFPRKDRPCGKCAEPAKSACCPAPGESSADLPPNAQPGECYAKTMVPAQYKTVTERHLVREASDQIEIVPAQFKWVEERIMVKECSTVLEAVPAEYKWSEKTIEVAPAHTGWVLQSAADCINPDKAMKGDVFCLRTTPPVFKTIRTQCLARPASVRQVTIPAEYQTIRKQVVACPATTKRVCIAAEYEDVQRTVLVCPERVKWARIVCEDKLTSETVNKVKTALLTSGFTPGPLNGTFTPEDRAALVAFQQKRGLGVGQLSYETLKELGISLQ